MKTCPACKHAADDNAVVCLICGATLPAAPAPAVSTEPPVAPKPPAPPTPAVDAYPPIGQAHATVQPAPAPVYTPYATPATPPQANWQQPPAPPAPVTPPAPSKAKVIVGMALSIAGLGFGILGVILGFMLIAMGAATNEVYVSGLMGFLYGFIYCMFGLPLSIVGFVMSKNSLKAGSQSNMCQLGVKFGIAGIIVNAASAVLAIVGLVQFITHNQTTSYQSFPYYY